MGGCKARLFVQNFGAVLVVIVISAGDAIFAKFHKKYLKRAKLPISRYMVSCFFQEAVFLGLPRTAKGPAPGPHMGPYGPTLGFDRSISLVGGVYPPQRRRIRWGGVTPPRRRRIRDFRGGGGIPPPDISPPHQV